MLSRELIRKILDVGRLAPSGGNKQPWHFIVVDDREAIKEISRLKTESHKWIENASLIIVGTTDPLNAGVYNYGGKKKNLCEIDLAISMAFMDLAAVSLGLGTCWVACYEDRKIKKLLDIPLNLRLVVMLVIGNGEPISISRNKDLEAISSYLKYKKPISELL